MAVRMAVGVGFGIYPRGWRYNNGEKAGLPFSLFRRDLDVRVAWGLP